jgi:hypothetical protein
MKKIEFEFDEERIIKEFYDYIVSTYSQHYANGKNGKQLLSEYDINDPDVIGFCKISARKYLKRLGSKEGFNRKDLLKAMHFCLLLLHFYPQKETQLTGENTDA